jgi:hypothetical protein
VTSVGYSGLGFFMLSEFEGFENGLGSDNRENEYADKEVTYCLI